MLKSADHHDLSVRTKLKPPKSMVNKKVDLRSLWERVCGRTRRTPLSYGPDMWLQFCGEIHFKGGKFFWAMKNVWLLLYVK